MTNQVSDFAPGELVMVGERRPLLAIVLEAQPPEFASHNPDRYVWVRYLATGEDGWWFDYQLEKPND